MDIPEVSWGCREDLPSGSPTAFALISPAAGRRTGVRRAVALVVELVMAVLPLNAGGGWRPVAAPED
ncbi:hypothetical protein [Streptomyces sp. Ru72]|uniref:hypothetical protein n=1 Tax=Streptomyces sp. Ru72 TaxID=2080747 RepID=UPI000CDD6D65|nr:hypothetical protein [Streptomyces sp. Ru72]POX49260.1 hypothetical protein C3488_18015 [Streptomyces sp. Ru72]